jgi:hypothetical protein
MRLRLEPPQDRIPSSPRVTAVLAGRCSEPASEHLETPGTDAP